MKRQLFTSVMCLVLMVIMLVSTTIAWFSDSTGNVNTMVAGKISIEQREYSDADHTVEFENNEFCLMPSQTVTKEVVVHNTGDQACYVRTLFAFEDDAQGNVLALLKTTGLGMIIPGVTNADEKIRFVVKKDGTETIYTVGYYIHSDALPAGGSINPLDSVMLSSDATNDWREAVGSHYEIFILSQAVQQAGLDDVGAEAALNTAFGNAPISADQCVIWFRAMLKARHYVDFDIFPYS